MGERGAVKRSKSGGVRGSVKDYIVERTKGDDSRASRSRRNSSCARYNFADKISAEICTESEDDADSSYELTLIKHRVKRQRYSNGDISRKDTILLNDAPTL